MTDSLAEMRARAMQWIEPGNCAPVTRDTAQHEEHLALDVVELLAEVERLRDACGHGERICAQLASERDDYRRRMNRYEQQLAQWEQIAAVKTGFGITPNDSVVANRALDSVYTERHRIILPLGGVDHVLDREAAAHIVRQLQAALDATSPLDELSDVESGAQHVADLGRLDSYFSTRLAHVLESVGNTVAVRVRLCLINARILTLAELLDRDRYALLKINQFGSTCLAEVEKALAKYGLSLSAVDAAKERSDV